MAMRVRKVAKELKRDPAEVIGLLHALGFERYRTVDDMLPDHTIASLQEGIRLGVKPVEVQFSAPKKTVKGAAPSPGLMDQLVPGVVPTGKQGQLTAVSPSPESAPPAKMEPSPEPAAEPARHGREEALEQREEALRKKGLELESERRSWELQREAERQQLNENTREALGLPTLLSLLEQRGLKGTDECVRAMRALDQKRLFEKMIMGLSCHDPAAISQLLESKLVLVGVGSAGPSHKASVIVSAERAEVIEEDLSQFGRKFGDILLLNGLRRITLVSGAPSELKEFFETVDSRIEVQVVVAGERTGPEAESTVARTDVVVLWKVSETPEAQEVFDTSRALIVRSNSNSPSAIVDSLQSALTVTE